MQRLRTLLFNLIYYPGSILYAALFLPCLVTRRSTHWGIHLWAYGVIWLMRTVLGLTYNAEVEGKLPQQNAIYACKHQSAWETMVLWVLVPRALFVMKKELYYIPFVGLWIWRAGNIAIDRKAGMSAIKQMIKQARARVAEGYNIIIFPEGTRITPGESHPFLPGVAALYKYLGVPVVPMALNSGYFWPRNAVQKKSGSISLRYLESIQPGMTSGDFMQSLQQRINNASDALPKES